MVVIPRCMGFIPNFWFSSSQDRPETAQGPYQCGRYRRHWSWVEQDTEFQVCAPWVHSDDQPNPSRRNTAARGRGRLQQGRVEVHAAPGRQAENQGPRLLTWAVREVALWIAGTCPYNPDECRSPGHSSGSGCAGPAIWSDQAPG